MQWNLKQKELNQIENYNVRVKFTVMLIYLLKELYQFRQIALDPNKKASNIKNLCTIY